MIEIESGKKDNAKYNLEDKDALLILAIRELTGEIKKLREGLK